MTYIAHGQIGGTQKMQSRPRGHFFVRLLRHTEMLELAGKKTWGPKGGWPRQRMAVKHTQKHKLPSECRSHRRPYGQMKMLSASVETNINGRGGSLSLAYSTALFPLFSPQFASIFHIYYYCCQPATSLFYASIPSHFAAFIFFLRPMNCILVTENGKK